MAVGWREVLSSSVDQIGHDPETDELHVTWKSGKTSIFSAVPPEKAHTVMNAWSVGKALNEMIKPNHAHRYSE